MIQYTSKDIIERAKQIADLEDSSFISWNENITLLNEAYSSFYQKVIDKDENYFIKNIELNVGDNVLPNDFYQIKYVCLISGKNNTPILRRAKTDNFSNLSYDVFGNRIIINGLGSGSGKIILSYYVVPQTLTFPNDSFEIELPDRVYGFELKDVRKNLWLFYKDNIVQVWNKKYDVIITKELTGENPVKFLVAENGFVYTTATESGKACFFNGEDYELGISGNKVEIENDKIKLYQTEAEHIIKIDGIEITTTDGKLYLDEKEFNSIHRTDINSELIITDDGLHFIEGGNETYSIPNGEDEYLFIAGIDSNSGYGYIVKNIFTGKYKMVSYLSDTKLNFSNTFFFPIIAYSLAKSYKIKQNGDISAIDLKYKEVEQQFYDSLSMDSNNCVRITNVYD